MTSGSYVLQGLAISMRPKQWSKNLFIFAGILFSGKLYDLSLFVKCVEAFALFCLASSSIYILNDLVDIEGDQAHPTKRFRPIAAGEISVLNAGFFSALLAVLAVELAFWIQPLFGWVIVLYILQNIFYSLVLKSIVILDILVISAGFGLRVISGSIVADVLPSEWVLLSTIFLALFLGFGKRRGEMVLLSGNAEKHRSNLAFYTREYLDYLTFSMATLSIVSYLLFVLTSGHKRSFMLTIPFTLYAILRYLYLLFVENKTQSPEVLALEDKPLMVSIVGWTAACVVALYFF